MKLILLVLLLSSYAWSACGDDVYTVEKFIPLNLKTVEEIYSLKGWSILYRKNPSEKELLKWGQQIYDNNPLLRKANIQEAAGVFDYAEVVPEPSFIKNLGQRGFDRKLEKIQNQREKYLTELIQEVQTSKNKIIQSSIDDTVKFLKDTVGYQLANILDNIPENMKESYKGLELALQKFYTNMGKYNVSDKPVSLKISEVLTGPQNKKQTLEALPDVALTPELLELEELWSSIQKQAYKRQEEVLSPTFEFLDSLKNHIGMTKPSADDPIVILNNKILESLSKQLDIEVMPYTKGLPYDVNLHDALSTMPGTGLPKNQIVHVAELGFTRKGKDLPLKFAKVVVSE